jgi:hypothetical protein
MFTASLPPATTSEDLVLPIIVRVRDTNTPLDLTGCTITIRFYNQQDSDCRSPVLTATNSDAITVPATGSILLTYLTATATQWSGLSPGVYTLLLTISRSGMTRNILRATLPVNRTP